VPTVPLFPLGIVALPREEVPLHIFEPRYREMTARCLAGDKSFVIVFADDDGRREVASTVRIIRVLEQFDDGRSNILVGGETVVRIDAVHDVESYATADVTTLEEATAAAPAERQDEALAAFARLSATAGYEGDPPEQGPFLSYALAGRVELAAPAKQSLLELRDESERLRRIVLLLRAAERGLALTAAAQERARRNGRVRTADELASDLGLDL
jgi:Lon protease-like protein